MDPLFRRPRGEAPLGQSLTSSRTLRLIDGLGTLGEWAGPNSALSTRASKQSEISPKSETSVGLDDSPGVNTDSQTRTIGSDGSNLTISLFYSWTIGFLAVVSVF